MQRRTLPHWPEGGEMRAGNYPSAEGQKWWRLQKAGIFSPANEGLRSLGRQWEVSVYLYVCVCDCAEKRKMELERESPVCFYPCRRWVLIRHDYIMLYPAYCVLTLELYAAPSLSLSAVPVQTKPSHTQAPIESRAWGSSQCGLLKGILALRFKISYSWTSSRIKSVFSIGIRQIHFCWTGTEILTWIQSDSTPTDHNNMV